VAAHWRSCVKCQQNRRDGLRKAPMVRRDVSMVVFEQVAIDPVVGPFEKGRGGARYLLSLAS